MKMKKLMVGALAVIASLCGGAAFGACEYIAKDTGWVYKWKFTGKTTYGAKTKSASSACGTTGTCTIRCPASLKIEGYTWMCSPGCGTDSFEVFSEVNEVFWQNKPVKAAFAGGVATEVCNIIGKKAKNCEVAGTATFDEFCRGGDRAAMYQFTYAGLGKYDRKNGRIKSASGNFAGYIDSPVRIEDCMFTNAGYWQCGTLALVCDEKRRGVVYGKWSVKYKKDASRKFARKGQLPRLPSWAKPNPS